MQQNHHLVFSSLGDFTRELETKGQLVRVGQPVSTVLEVTELHRRVIARQGPALLLQHPVKADGATSEVPLLTNLFGTVDRIAFALGGGGRRRLSSLGQMLARLRQPTPPTTMREVIEQWPLAKSAYHSRPLIVGRAAVHADVRRGADIDLARIMHQR